MQAGLPAAAAGVEAAGAAGDPGGGGRDDQRGEDHHDREQQTRSTCRRLPLHASLAPPEGESSVAGLSRDHLKAAFKSSVRSCLAGGYQEKGGVLMLPPVDRMTGCRQLGDVPSLYRFEVAERPGSGPVLTVGGKLRSRELAVAILPRSALLGESGRSIAAIPLRWAKERNASRLSRADRVEEVAGRQGRIAVTRVRDRWTGSKRPARTLSIAGIYDSRPPG